MKYAMLGLISIIVALSVYIYYEQESLRREQCNFLQGELVGRSYCIKEDSILKKW